MKGFNHVVSAAVLLLLIIGSGGCVEVQNSALLGQLLMAATTTALDESTVAAGLKEALRVGSERAVGTTSQTDGFLGNTLIRIAMPEQLDTVATTLRQVGMGAQVDQFEVAMNRAAESAAGEAKSVFWDSITQMTLSDAMGILHGNETAATDYFRDKTATTLAAKFKPIVQQKMKTVGLYGYYNQLMGVYQSLPFTSKPQFDLDRYVADKAQQGLFTTLAEEEKLLRRDPASRSTELLKKVFAAQD
ncbi:MAG: DUF4197 domain-containing protein [Desulfuromonas sp.]|nr:DUF4197 domain-containing protein [Desulfuromonas sp.]